MTKPVTITLQALHDARACTDQYDAFFDVFGETLTLESEQQAVDIARANPGFDYGWAARNLLSQQMLEEYARLLTPLLNEYERQRAPMLGAEEQRQRALMWAEHQQQQSARLAEYRHQRAENFARLYWRENSK